MQSSGGKDMIDWSSKHDYVWSTYRRNFKMVQCCCSSIINTITRMWMIVWANMLNVSPEWEWSIEWKFNSHFPNRKVVWCVNTSSKDRIYGWQVCAHKQAMIASANLWGSKCDDTDEATKFILHNFDRIWSYVYFVIMRMLIILTQCRARLCIRECECNKTILNKWKARSCNNLKPYPKPECNKLYEHQVVRDLGEM